MSVAETLASLRDVDDVVGSFLLNDEGRLIARDLPAMFAPDVFGDVGSRLVRLRETLESNGDPMSSLTLRFADHKLHVRAFGVFLLGVVTSAKVNVPALRMALNLVSRRLAAQAGTLAAEVVNAEPAGQQTTRSEIAARGDIVFRGRRF